MVAVMFHIIFCPCNRQQL